MPRLTQPSTVTTFTVTHHEGALPTVARLQNDPGLALAQVAAFFESLATGGNVGTVEVVRSDEDDAVAASGSVEFSGASGAITVTINGVALAVSGYADDEDAVSELVNAISASVNPLVEGVVTATLDGASVNIFAAEPGAAGNLVTLAASGTGVTVSGNRLAGGADTTDAAKATIRR